MKLSEDGVRSVQARYEILSAKVTRWYQTEHRKLGLQPNFNPRFHELGAEESRQLAEGLAQIYIEAYEREGHELDAREIDEIMQKISTTVGQSHQALSDARNLLEADVLEARISKARTAQPVATARSIPNFAFVKDEDIRKVVTRDYAELDQLDPGVATKSVLVLAGSILEGLLLDALVTGGKWTPEEAFQKGLNDMIHPAEACGIIHEGRVSNLLRLYRNLIHPAREIRRTSDVTPEDAKLARAAVDVAIREVSAWHAARKS